MTSVTPRTWTTPSGKIRKGWRVSWYADDTDGKPKRFARQFSGPRARAKANAERRRIDGLLSAGVRAPGPNGRTFLEAAERWIDKAKKAGREPTTTEGYEQHLENHLAKLAFDQPHRKRKKRLGAMAVSEITAPDCERIKAALIAKLSPGMAVKVMHTFRMALNDAVREGDIAQNPAAATRIVLLDRGEDSEVDIPTRAELTALLAAARTREAHPPTFAEVWVTLTTLSGLRPSENRGLAIADLELDGKEPGLRIRRRANARCQLGPVKTAKGRRFVKIGPQVVRLLRRWLVVVPKGDLRLVFPTMDGTVQSHANIYNRMWVPLCQKAGLIRDGQPLYSLNCLRHVAASLSIEAGMNAKQLQMKMGHASITTTMDIYGHLFRDAADDTGDRIEADVLGRLSA